MKILKTMGPALAALAMLPRLGNARPVATDMTRSDKFDEIRKAATCVEMIAPGGTGEYCTPPATLTANPTTLFENAGSAGTFIVVEYPETPTPQQTSTKKSAWTSSGTIENVTTSTPLPSVSSVMSSPIITSARNGGTPTSPAKSSQNSFNPTETFAPYPLPTISGAPGGTRNSTQTDSQIGNNARRLGDGLGGGGVGGIITMIATAFGIRHGVKVKRRAAMIARNFGPDKYSNLSPQEQILETATADGYIRGIPQLVINEAENNVHKDLLAALRGKDGYRVHAKYCNGDNIIIRDPATNELAYFDTDDAQCRQQDIQPFTEFSTFNRITGSFSPNKSPTVGLRFQLQKIEVGERAVEEREIGETAIGGREPREERESGEKLCFLPWAQQRPIDEVSRDQRSGRGAIELAEQTVARSTQQNSGTGRSNLNPTAAVQINVAWTPLAARQGNEQAPAAGRLRLSRSLSAMSIVRSAEERPITRARSRSTHFR